jgi:hypothetical protein
MSNLPFPLNNENAEANLQNKTQSLIVPKEIGLVVIPVDVKYGIQFPTDFTFKPHSFMPNKFKSRIKQTIPVQVVNSGSRTNTVTSSINLATKQPLVYVKYKNGNIINHKFNVKPNISHINKADFIIAMYDLSELKNKKNIKDGELMGFLNISSKQIKNIYSNTVSTSIFSEHFYFNNRYDVNYITPILNMFLQNTIQYV